MNPYKTLLSCLLFLSLVSCESNEQHLSPNAKYIIEVITTDYDLYLNLLNGNSELLDNKKTGASEVMKWSVNWHNDSTVVLHSHDIGTYAWMVSNDKLIKIPITNEMNFRSIEAFDVKYKVKNHLKSCLEPLTEYEINVH